jgi:hypothetical protein
MCQYLCWWWEGFARYLSALCSLLPLFVIVLQWSAGKLHAHLWHQRLFRKILRKESLDCRLSSFPSHFFFDSGEGSVRWRETPHFNRRQLDPWPVRVVSRWADFRPRQHFSTACDANTLSDGGHAPPNCSTDDSPAQFPAPRNNQSDPGVGKRQCHIPRPNLWHGGPLQRSWTDYANIFMRALNSSSLLACLQTE